MAGRLSKPMRVLLVLSLALNLFGAGAIAASAVMDRGWLAGAFGLHHHRPPRIMGMPNPRQLHAVLPESGRVILKETLDAHRPRFRENLRGLFAARRAVAEAIKADPFDRTRLEAAFTTLRDREANVATAAQATMADLVSRLDADERDAVAELLTVRQRRRE
ncbi:periplasmic heavy metal sensor [Rhodospirillaceae bacterium SYSU D60014]|uniref:periplasmic heavy metal sensor n=1 Tax=Virgifigura deserti TaxID=2268457 RepID=UPI000E6639B9